MDLTRSQDIVLDWSQKVDYVDYKMDEELYKFLERKFHFEPQFGSIVQVLNDS